MTGEIKKSMMLETYLHMIQKEEFTITLDPSSRVASRGTKYRISPHLKFEEINGIGSPTQPPNRDEAGLPGLSLGKINIMKGWFKPTDPEIINLLTELIKYICLRVKTQFRVDQAIGLTTYNSPKSHQSHRCYWWCKKNYEIFKQSPENDEFDIANKEPCLRTWLYPSVHFDCKNKLTKAVAEMPWYGFEADKKELKNVNGIIRSVFVSKSSQYPKLWFEIESGLVNTYSSEKELESDMMFVQAMMGDCTEEPQPKRRRLESVESQPKQVESVEFKRVENVESQPKRVEDVEFKHVEDVEFQPKWVVGVKSSTPIATQSEYDHHATNMTRNYLQSIL